MLTANLFLDFGEFFPSGGLTMTADELRDTFGANGLQGPDLVGKGNTANPIAANTDLAFTSLQSVMNSAFDYNNDGNTDSNDYTDLRRDVLSLVQRYYEPFDVLVQLAPPLPNVDSDAYLDGVRAQLQQGSNVNGERDAWVFVAGVTRNDGGTTVLVGNETSLNGIASGLDIPGSLDNAKPNAHDDSAVAFADNILAGLTGSEVQADTQLAYTAAHEAGHTFGLWHTWNGIAAGITDVVPGAAGNASIQVLGNLASDLVVGNSLVVRDAANNSLGTFTIRAGSPPYDPATGKTTINVNEAIANGGGVDANGNNLLFQYTTDQSRITSSNLVTGSAGGGNRGTFDSVTRFELVGDYAVNFGIGNGDYSPYELLARNENLGLKADAPAFVTGTGAFDRITVSRVSDTAAIVTVESFQEAAFTNQIRNTLTYQIDTSHGIQIDAGANDDLIVLDGDLGVEIAVRGMAGTDRLEVRGKNAAHGAYAPAGATKNALDETIAYAGLLTVGDTKIRFDEYESDGLILVHDVNNFAATTPNGADDIDVEATASGAGRTRVEGESDGAPFVPLEFFNVANFVLDAGAGDGLHGDDDVTIKNPLAASGLQIFSVLGGAGDDALTVDTEGGLSTIAGGVRFDGGAGFDRVKVVGTINDFDGESIFLASAPGNGRHELVEGGDTQRIEFENIEPFTTVVPAASFDITSAPGIVSLLQADNSITYTASQIIANGGQVTVDDFEPIEFGNKTDVTISAGSGEDTVVLDNSQRPSGLETLGVVGGEGNDTILALNVPVAAAGGFQHVSLDGQAGDDEIDVRGAVQNTPFLLLGGDGNDALTGGRGDDQIDGGAGDDLLAGGDAALTGNLGANIFDGGSGFDALLIQGTLRNDVLDVFQVAPTNAAGDNYTLNVSVNGASNADRIVPSLPTAPNDPANRPSVEAARIEAGLGDDLIRVGHSDVYSDPANNLVGQTVRFEVHGGSPHASDRLIVRDDGVGDLVLARQSSDEHSGTVTVAPAVGGGLAPVVYDDIERLDVLPVDPVTGDPAGGQIVIFQDDPFEANDNRLIATETSDVLTTWRNPAIDPGGATNPFGDGRDAPGDEDWYKFRASETGGFRFEILFDALAAVPSGRPGLPGDGDLSLAVFDADGNLIVHGRANTAGDGADATVSAAAGAMFYVRVRGGGEAAPDALAINTYALQVNDADLLGPQVYDPDGAGPQQAIQIVTNGVPNANFNLFDVKPVTQGPTPLVDGLLVNVRDLLTRELTRRAPGNVLPALDEIVAETAGNYRLAGDAVGNIAIESVEAVNAPTTLASNVTAVVSAGQFTAAGLVGNPAPPTAGDLLLLTSGPNQGQIRAITTYDAATGQFTFADPFLNAPAAGDTFTVFKIATATIQLNFAAPLPDDRFTLTISDSVVDPAGNALDGESAAAAPFDDPSAIFPTGDGQAGGAFVARFTVDTRPEAASYAGTSVYADTNGNFFFDAENADTTNEDIAYLLGIDTDDIFVGNFVKGANADADGFDKIAAYGNVHGAWRWILDTDNDGKPDLFQTDPLGIAGVPVAGDFDGDADNGDEVGLFTGASWWLDTNHDFMVDTQRPSFIRNGRPIVGDFNRDGADDLALWRDDHFYFDLTTGGVARSWDGAVDESFRFGFSATREIPVAADLNQDGWEDLGLWVADRAGAAPGEGGEWYFLVSEGQPLYATGNPDAKVVFDPHLQENVYLFHPEPFGSDFLMRMGDDDSMPLLGNFDPPVASSGAAPTNGLHQNFANAYDVDGDGQVTPFDALALANDVRANGRRTLRAEWNTVPAAPYLDVDGDQHVSPFDVLGLANYLRNQDRSDAPAQRMVASAPPAAEPAASEAPFVAGGAFSSAAPAEAPAAPFWFTAAADAPPAADAASTPPVATPPDADAAEKAWIAEETADPADRLAATSSRQLDAALDDMADDVAAAWEEDAEDPLAVDLSWS